MMKKMTLMLVALVTGIALSACAPTPDQLRKVVEENPDIVFKAIEKDPKGFFDTIQKAQGAARAAMEAEQEKKEKGQLEEEFKNPKKPTIGKDRIIFGNPKAEVTIVEYSDFQCPYCSRAAGTVSKILKEYGDKVRVVYKHLPFKPYSEPAARYFEAIGMQDSAKAHKFHNMIYGNQRDFSGEGEAYLKKAAKKVGADLTKLKKDLKSEAVNKRLAADMAEAKKFEFTGTPGFIVNGVTVRGAYPFEHFKMIIDRHLKSKK